MLRSLLAPPGLGDVLSLLRYVLEDPYLFIGSTTVMTSALVLAVLALAAFAGLGRGRAAPVARAAEGALAWLAPRLSLALAWFGVGSMVLATEILIRFHDINPAGTEAQFRSGIGHLAVALLGIAALRPRLRGLSARSWVEAHFWALSYLTMHVLVLTPPWFAFQHQLDLVMGVARTALVTALAVNLVLWWRLSPAPAAATPATTTGEAAPAEA